MAANRAVVIVGGVARRGASRERCAHCGAGAGRRPVEGSVRGCTYRYCGQVCFELHAVAVELWSPWCGCGEAAYGDTAVCEEHLADPGLALAG